MNWNRVLADIPTFELAADTNYYAEQWGLGSWAAYRGDVSIGEPGTYGDRQEARDAAEAQYRAEGPVQHARWVAENYQAELDAATEPDAQLAELVRRSAAALAELARKD